MSEPKWVTKGNPKEGGQVWVTRNGQVRVEDYWFGFGDYVFDGIRQQVAPTAWAPLVKPRPYKAGG